MAMVVALAAERGVKMALRTDIVLKIVVYFHEIFQFLPLYDYTEAIIGNFFLFNIA